MATIQTIDLMLNSKQLTGLSIFQNLMGDLNFQVVAHDEHLYASKGTRVRRQIGFNHARKSEGKLSISEVHKIFCNLSQHRIRRVRSETGLDARLMT